MLNERSKKNLVGVHPVMVKIVERANDLCPITVTEGLRTIERQKQLVAQKASKTMNSRHLKGVDGYGHAVDLAPMVGDKVKDPKHWMKADFILIKNAMFQAAKEQGITLRWGGDFNMDGDKTTSDSWDSCHFELLASQYK